MMQAKTYHSTATHRMKYHISGIFSAEPGTFPVPRPTPYKGWAGTACAGTRATRVRVLAYRANFFQPSNRNDYD